MLFNVGSTIISMHNSNFYNSRKGKNAGVFNVQFTKENLRSYLPLTPMPKGHSDSIDDNLPALPAYKGMLALLVIPSVFRCTVLPALILSFFLMFGTAAPSLCFQYFFDNSYFKLVGGHSYGEELF